MNREIVETSKMGGDYELALLMVPPWDIEKPPLNIAFLAEFMRAHGHKVWVKDLNISFYNEVHSRRWSVQRGQKSVKRLDMLWEMMSQNWIDPVQMTDVFFEHASDEIEREVNEILDTGARFIGISVHYRNVFFANRLARMIRERDPERIVIFGGPEVSADQRTGKMHELDADALVIGEGEHTLLEFLKANANRRKGELEPVAGSVVRLEGNDFTPYEPRPLIADLDSLPWPTYSDFDVFSYHPEPMPPRLPFLSSRGCIGKCSFCMDHYIAGRFRHRSPENAVAELKHHIERYKVFDFSFNDLLCNGNPKALERLAKKIIDENLRINWWSYAMIHKGMTYELFKTLRRSGCVNIDFGMEAASNKVLK
ncbi:MAG TPA: radical SAM protein, partial [Proteobacteria bacterium]|nr:radical SAM protein [Pseudomonadota bacterium]